ncbi:hypothetical protein [Labilibaculum sp.]|uniref:DUF7670 domain-containing protein n=1 Tax=Labilibaculum sp. TaxID=2060723 RepID=UPI002AA6324E|nr:hypothetical protein [Labilibaculum sp.]MBN2596141.1 hypothetical protein [Marinifilaceae bacterium]
MEKRMLFQDNPSQFYLIAARIIGFLITGVFMLFMVPEFIALLSKETANNEGWILIFYLLSIAYGCSFLISFWKVGLGGLLLVISSVLITLYAFIDSNSWIVLLLFIPLSFSGILFLIYWRKKQIS